MSHASWPSLGINSSASFSSTILQEEAKLRWDSDEELKRVSLDLLRLQKWGLIIGLIILNAVLIWVGWTYWQVYYLFIVLLSSNTMLQAFMILCIVLNFLFRKVLCTFWQPKEIIPVEPEKLVLLLHNETHQ